LTKAPDWRTDLSIRTRLTLWYIGLLAAILIAFALLLYAFLVYNLRAEVDQTLQTRAQQVAASLQAENDPLSIMLLGLVTLPPIDVFSSPGVYVQVLRTDGSIARRSANLEDQYLPIDQEVFERNLHGGPVLYTLQINQVRLRIFSAPLTVAGQIIGAVQVGQSLYEVDSTLRTVRLLLIGGIAATLLLAALVGAFLARTALRPIDRIAQTALRISRAEDLSQRLARTGPQDEVGRLAATFNEMLGRLEELFTTQQRLVADVSHELRTPLTTIRGNIDLLRRGAAEDSKARRETLEAIEGEVTRMSRMVADLLLLAQADAGIELENKPVELDTLLLEVYRQGQLMADGVEVKLGHEDQAVVMGDADRLKQLLLNLVDNAIKYTPAGGEVRLSLYHEQGWVQVAVSDTGMGIPPEDLPHIFERFYFTDKARRRWGTGLGLSIAKWIAEAHGGHLTVESEVGKGSTFTVWLRPTTAITKGPVSG
jgi:two-component system OmpR family sensor kinase